MVGGFPALPPSAKPRPLSQPGTDVAPGLLPGGGVCVGGHSIDGVQEAPLELEPAPTGAEHSAVSGSARRGRAAGSALLPPAPRLLPGWGWGWNCCSEHETETALYHFQEAEHPPGLVGAQGTHFTSSQGTPIAPQHLGCKFGKLPGSNSCPGVDPISRQLAAQSRLGLEGSAALSPRGYLGLPVLPAGPWDEAAPTVPLCSSPPGLWHDAVLLAATLPEGNVEIACGPSGCSWGSAMLGEPWGPVLSPAVRLPAGLRRRRRAGRAAARPHPSPLLELSRCRLRIAGGQRGVALGVLSHNISCPCLWQQVEPEVPVRSRPAAPPEPPPALL